MYRKAETIYREAEMIYCKAGMIYRKAETIYHRQETISRKATRYLAGLEKYLNSTLPVGQVTLKILLARRTSPLAQFFKLINNS